MRPTDESDDSGDNFILSPMAIAAKFDLETLQLDALNRLATVRSGPNHSLFWRLLKRLDCTVQSFVGLDWTVPKTIQSDANNFFLFRYRIF